MPGATLEALLAYADVEIPVGGGCCALRLSRRQMADRDLRARLGARLDRLAGLTVICANGTGALVTILHDHGGGERRRYRRAA